LCGDPKHGAAELESLDRHWVSCARPEDRYALASALRELEDTRLVQGVARVWVLLIIAWVRVGRGETAQLAEGACEILDLARAGEDPRAEADAQCLLGAVLQSHGELEEAQRAFGEYLAISRRLAKQDPSNAGWQRELAGAYSWVGAVLQAQGELETAQRVFGENLAISRRLAEQDPSNAGWQRELAVALGSVGGVLRAQGELQGARAAFRKALTISRRLAEQDPSNAGWQRDLAVACWRIAHLEVKAGKHAAALPLYEEAYRTFGFLAETAPGFVQWAKDKEDVESELSRCRILGLASNAGKGMEEPDTLTWLKERTSSDEDTGVRQAAVQELARGWKEDPDTLSILKERAGN
jgi:tetratricopeptide (TPR) repeat protein